MSKYFVTAGIIAVVFSIVKFLEMRFITKDNKPIKNIVRDTLTVYVSATLGLLVLEQVDSVEIGQPNASVFIGNPEF